MNIFKSIYRYILNRILPKRNSSHDVLQNLLTEFQEKASDIVNEAKLEDSRKNRVDTIV